MVFLNCRFQFQIQKKRFWIGLGLPNPLKLAPSCLHEAPRWRPNRLPKPQDGCPAGLWALQTAIQADKDSSLEVPGHSRPRFGPPGAHFAPNLGAPGARFGCPDSILRARELHVGGSEFPCWKPWGLISILQTSQSFQASKPPNFQ